MFLFIEIIINKQFNLLFLVQCVVPENIHTSLDEGFFSNTSPPLWKFQLQISFIHFFDYFGLPEPPPPLPGNSNTFCGGGGAVWIFSGPTQCTTAFLKPYTHT